MTAIDISYSKVQKWHRKRLFFTPPDPHIKRYSVLIILSFFNTMYVPALCSIDTTIFEQATLVIEIKSINQY